MAMSRKTYKALAEDYRAIRPPSSQREAMAVWKLMVESTANVMEADNHSFNRDRFYEACGWEGADG